MLALSLTVAEIGLQSGQFSVENAHFPTRLPYNPEFENVSLAPDR